MLHVVMAMNCTSIVTITGMVVNLVHITAASPQKMQMSLTVTAGLKFLNDWLSRYAIFMFVRG